MSSYKLFILSKKSCPYCIDLKKELAANPPETIDFEFVDVQEEDDDHSFLQSIPPYHSVPHIVLAKKEDRDSSNKSYRFVAELPEMANRDAKSLDAFYEHHRSNKTSSRKKRSFKTKRGKLRGGRRFRLISRQR
jgi:glutaredoxin